MSISASKRLPLGDHIVFPKSKKGDLLKALTKTKEFKRLSRIQQLGFSDVSFPGVTHNRYEHSLGVYARACDFCDRIKEKFPKYYDKHKAFELKIKALLHDVGHGPYSHSFEIASSALGDGNNHEVWTSRVVLGDTEIGNLLQEYDDENGTDLRQTVGRFFEEEKVETFWDSILTSQFDVDRLDYLRRDAYNAYIPVDVDSEYLLKKVELAEHEGEAYVAFGLKALPNLEGFLQSRSKLYNKLYHDPDCQACDFLFAEVCKSVRKELGDKSPEALGLSPQNAMVKYLQSSGHTTLSTYLSLTDSQVDTFLDEVEHSTAAQLKQAAKRVERMRSDKPLHIVNLAEYKRDFSRADFDKANDEFQRIAEDVNGGAIAIADYFQKAAYNPNKPMLEQILISTVEGVCQVSEASNGLASDIKHGYFMSENPQVISRFKQVLPQLVA